MMMGPLWFSSLSSLQELSKVDIFIITTITILLAIVVQKKILIQFEKKRANKDLDRSISNISERSRLLRNQFGSIMIPSDLVLQEEEIDTIVNKQEQKSSSKKKEEEDAICNLTSKTSKHVSSSSKQGTSNNNNVNIKNTTSSKNNKEKQAIYSTAAAVATTTTTNDENNNASSLLIQEKVSKDEKENNVILKNNNDNTDNVTTDNHSNKNNNNVSQTTNTTTKNNYNYGKDDNNSIQQQQQESLIQSSLLLQTTTTTTANTNYNDNNNIHHPGLEQFWYWWDIETSLFRIYTIPGNSESENNNNNNNIPPYNPNSRRGNIPVSLHITNQTNHNIDVYWINYKGIYEYKDTIHSKQIWTHTTWIDHPWIFCYNENNYNNHDIINEESIILHYIPYRIIPNTSLAPTIDTKINNSTNNNNQRKGGKIIGIHQFQILPPKNNDDNNNADTTTTLTNTTKQQRCRIYDPILPYPAKEYIGNNKRYALDIALIHCIRMEYQYWDILKKYIKNIVDNNNDNNNIDSSIKYRKIRIANTSFTNMVWNTPGRGVLFAIGFIENGPYIEFFESTSTNILLLSNDTIQWLIQSLIMIEQYENKMYNFESVILQPQGADRYGRAGYRI